VSGDLVKTGHHDDPIPYMGDIENSQSLLSEIVPEQQRPRSLQELMSPNVNRLPKEHELPTTTPTGGLPSDYTAVELPVQQQTELPTPVSALYKESVSSSVLPEVSPESGLEVMPSSPALTPSQERANIVENINRLQDRRRYLEAINAINEEEVRLRKRLEELDS
jgi:hypothetical protein